ncbi:MAG: AarF/ABC1/UbiB kinase family protein, partial [Bdellovibrionales bacterium]|nr:AarF/ABC1/UbiB kinase family protein [Bdellovibrionales bacterium]
NIFILPNSKLGFIDFGMVGRLSRKTQSSIANMFVALAREDYDRLAYEYIELAPFNDRTDRDILAQDLRAVLSPFFGLSLKDVNMGKLLLQSTTVAAKNHVVLPSELMMFFKSLVTIEGLGRMVLDDFDLLPYMYEFSSEIIKTKISTKELFSDVGFQFKEWSSLFEALPKEIKTYFRKHNQANFRSRTEIVNLQSFERTIHGSSRMIFNGVIIASLIIAGAMMSDLEGDKLYGISYVSLIFFSFAMALFLRWIWPRRS